ncbi:MAG: molybdenum cofactor guanylyltransferase [bacterium]|nr:molybdenum cofactor guanylyltransferase [bacterium]
MLSIPNLILIGSTDRNLGKTRLSVDLISALSARTPVYGVKVTVIRSGGGPCPRGGEGCGVCSSLESEWLITEELDPTGAKDTCRLLAAGADSVLWLRVAENHVVEGMNALLEQLDEEAVIVAESNSLRRAVEPGMFVMVVGDGEPKPTAAAVLDLADRRIASVDGRAAVDARQLAREFLPPFSAVVLTGGESSRMGRDKALLEVKGRSVLREIVERLGRMADEVIVGASDPEQAATLRTLLSGAGTKPLRVICDDEPGQGPLMGIYSAMRSASHDLCFVTACDIPEPSLAHMLALRTCAARNDVVVTVEADGRMNAMLAFYSRAALPRMKAHLDEGHRRIVSFYDDVRVQQIPLANPGWYRNLNTPEDWREYLER